MENQMTVLENNEVRFSDYLSSHPHLYDGVELTQGDIDYINNEFWEFTVKEATFQTHFIQMIRKHIAQYKNLKQIEFCEAVFNIATNQSLQHTISHVTDDFKSDRFGHNENTTTNDLHNDTTTDNKSADKQLPMKSAGTSFDTTVSWTTGASGIAENKGETHNTNSGTVGIDADDEAHLTSLNNHWNDNNITTEERNGQAVNLIRNIWNYVVEPKAMEWFCNKLSPCFILCFD